MKETIKTVITDYLTELKRISKYLFDFPEEGYQEYKASKILCEALEEHGFQVEKGVYGIETAFKSLYKSGKSGPTIAFLCEYDALPDIGHGCGHNLIACMGLGAAIGLKSVIEDIGGDIIVLGTPAEETSGAKVEMVRRGAFDDVSVVMMAHPSPLSEESGTSLALNALEFDYRGKPAHAAHSPHKGINALDSVILLFNGINALRQHVSSTVRMHGIISEGGVAANIVPEHAVARFYVRAPKKELRDEVTEKVIAIAEGAASMTGAKMTWRHYEESYDDLRTNKTLSKAFNRNLLQLGEKQIYQNASLRGSLDIGNVSQVVPTIHPWIGMGDENIVPHTRQFAEHTLTERGTEAMLKGACSLAMTAYDVITSEELQQEILKEFKEQQNKI